VYACPIRQEGFSTEEVVAANSICDVDSGGINVLAIKATPLKKT